MSESFHVFLSHNSQDKPIVRKLAQELKLYDLRVWLDEEQLVPGHPWQEALETIIQTTQAAAVLIGESGLGPWENSEMRACLSELVDRKLPVIPVLLPGTPAAPKLPLFLKKVTWVDLREGLTDPGLEKLVWGITGVKPAKQARRGGRVTPDEVGYANELLVFPPEISLIRKLFLKIRKVYKGKFKLVFKLTLVLGSAILVFNLRLLNTNPEISPIPPGTAQIEIKPPISDEGRPVTLASIKVTTNPQMPA